MDTSLIHFIIDAFLLSAWLNMFDVYDQAFCVHVGAFQVDLEHMAKVLSSVRLLTCHRIYSQQNGLGLGPFSIFCFTI